MCYKDDEMKKFFRTEVIVLSTGETFKAIHVQSKNKYEEEQRHVKLDLTKEKTETRSTRNIVSVINLHAVALDQYFAGILKWTEKELKETDRKWRNLLLSQSSACRYRSPIYEIGKQSKESNWIGIPRAHRTQVFNEKSGAK